MPLPTRQLAAFLLSLAACAPLQAQAPPLLALDSPRPSPAAFPIAADGRPAAIYIGPNNPDTVRVAAQAFATDVQAVTGTRPQILTTLTGKLPGEIIVAGVLNHSPEIDALVSSRRLATTEIAGHWESALTTTIANPLPGHPEVHQALIIAGADRRGAAFALFTLSRAMGVSPWTWWADVPVPHHTAVYVTAGDHLQPSPSVQYRGIFLNDEDWGLRPWAAKKMDPAIEPAHDGQPAKGNIGPHTYEHIFELLLRLHANSLWPAMHPGSLAFNAVPENARLADRYGIVMGGSHSEALLRNNVGEWNEAPPPAGNGRWNYQTNAPAMRDYWNARIAANGAYENFYTVGLRGVHDSGLEASGSREVKAHLVEDVMADQRKILTDHIPKPIAQIPQVIWLYKESLDLYRAGMQVPPDVTLGWTDDNYGYLRELPTVAEQKRPGGSGVYYHVSYWGAPHDHLWLATTSPALIREEMSKAYDHNARKYWILNVGDLKPAELDIDYFLQLAWNEPATAALTEPAWLTQWLTEQFPTTQGHAFAGAPALTKPNTPGAPSTPNTNSLGAPSMTASPSWVGRTTSTNQPSPGAPSTPNTNSPGAPSMTASPSWVGRTTSTNQPSLATSLADILTRFYALNFIRKPEFMGFNGYNDGINRTAFNPLAWGTLPGDPTTPDPPDQNHARSAAWSHLSDQAQDLAQTVPPEYASAFFELIGYPVQAAAAMNHKFLSTDLTYLDAHTHNGSALATDTAQAQAAYDTIQTLTARYNSLENGKWDGIMSAHPRDRHVFEMPRTATLADANTPLPTAWAAGQPVSPPIAPGFVEQDSTVSINAAHFTRKSDGPRAHWNVLPYLGISPGGSVLFGSPGLLANNNTPGQLLPGAPGLAPETRDRTPAGSAPFLEYTFTTTSSGPATLTLHLLPTFPIDTDHRLRYAVALDDHPRVQLDAAPRTASTGGPANSNGDGPSDTEWPQNVLRNSAVVTLHLSTPLSPGAHTLRLFYIDPGVVFEHLVLTFPGAPPAYPVPPETGIPPAR